MYRTGSWSLTSRGTETRNRSVTAWMIRFGFGGTSHLSMSIVQCTEPVIIYIVQHLSMLMVRFSRSPSCLLIWDLRLA